MTDIIREIVADLFNVAPSVLTSHLRTREAREVAAAHTYMGLLKSELDMTLKDIAEHCGLGDHASSHHAISKFLLRNDYETRFWRTMELADVRVKKALDDFLKAA